MERPILPAILSCAGTELTDDEKKLFSASNPLGISLFSRNIKNKTQLKKLTDQIKNVINRDDVLIAVDEEGGRVSRLKLIIKMNNELKLQFVSEEELGKVSILYSKIQAELIASYMRKFGVNLTFAPVVDRKSKKHSLVFEGRCFSRNEKNIISRAQAMADTYIKRGICPCIKHLPGHFDTEVDPHLGILNISLSENEIYKQIDYMKAFANYPLAMTAHVILNYIDEDYPVTMSKKCIEEILRGYLGLQSFLISDALEMKSLKGTITEKAQNCWDAGIDAVCYCSGQYADLYNICTQKRFLTEKAQIRFAKIKKIIHNTPQEINTSDLEKKYIRKFQEKLNREYLYDATEVLHHMLEKGENK